MRRMLALITSCAALAGCATTGSTIVLKPDAALMQDCGPVIEQTKTNGQLAETILDYRKVLRDCNADKKALREWAKDNQ